MSDEQNTKSESGTTRFSELCERLIENGEHYLFPEISRTRSSDWIAVIFNKSGEPRVKLGGGQGCTLNEACSECVANYDERKAIEERKATLLQNPAVAEALRLFHVDVKTSC